MRHGITLLAVFVAGCGWLGGDSPLTSDDSLLRYVPADTPYVVAAVEPVPDEIADIYAEQLSLVMNMVELGTQTAIEELRSRDAAGGGNPVAGDPAENLEALEIVAELTSPEMLRATGINRDSTSVFYGFGLLPVFRVTLAEGHEIERVLDRMEALIELDGQAAVETGSVAGQAYRYIEVDQARVVAAVLENELVLTAMPVTFGDAELQSVLGLVLPEETISDSGRLDAIADEYGLTQHLVAMLDTGRLAETFLDEPTATDAVLLDLMGYDAQSVSAACRNEFRELAGVAPLMVSGYTELNAASMGMTSVVELREDIAAGLAGIPTPVPGLGAATDAMIGFGMSFDMSGVRQFVAARIETMSADPYECEALTGLQDLLPSARMYLSQPLPPFVEGLKGFSATMDFGEIDFASPTPMPTEMEMSVLVATDDVEGTLAMASALDPQFAALDLRTDGQIVELQSSALFADPAMNPFGPVFFAATETEIGLALGENGETRLADLMQSPPGDPSTFLSMSVDMAAYYGLLADAMESTILQDPAAGPAPAAAISSITDLMRSLQAIYSRETLEIRFTERGIEVPVRLDLVQ